jgi:D-amino-acid dehydrogenase
MQHSPLVICPLLDPAMWRWGLRLLANCTARAYALNKSRMVPLAEYSRDCLKALRAETGIAYDERTQGTLQLFRTQKQLDGIGGDIEILRSTACPSRCSTATASACRAGAARTAHKFVGALRLPNDETGDCFTFTNRLAAMAAAGRAFRWGTRIDRLEVAAGASTACAPSAGRLSRPRGAGAGQLLAAAAARRSASASRSTRSRAIRSPCRSPTRPARPSRPSWTRRTRWRSRAWATASASAARPSWPATTSAARGAARDAGACGRRPLPARRRRRAAEFWCGLRPMTPDGTPIVGRRGRRQPAAGHRARHAGLDDGGRHRARGGRPGGGAAAGDRHRGPSAGSRWEQRCCFDLPRSRGERFPAWVQCPASAREPTMSHSPIKPTARATARVVATRVAKPTGLAATALAAALLFGAQAPTPRRRSSRAKGRGRRGVCS